MAYLNEVVKPRTIGMLFIVSFEAVGRLVCNGGVAAFVVIVSKVVSKFEARLFYAGEDTAVEQFGLESLQNDSACALLPHQLILCAAPYYPKFCLIA